MSPDVAASVRARLLNQARASGEEFQLTLTRFAAERLLFRLGASSARSRCILKGASLLAVWLPDPYRATRDVDLLLVGRADDAAIRSLVEEICAVVCPEDALRFDLSEMVVETIRPEDENAGKRTRFRAWLHNARIAVQVDFGVSDALATPPEEIIYPTMLDTMPTPRLRAYPKVATVSEKFEAMVKLETLNSRMKDFHDVWALANTFDFDGPSLRGAVAACFERRGTPWTDGIPRVLTSDFYQLPEMTTRWRNYLAAGAVLVPPPARFADIGERIATFLGPVRGAIVTAEAFEASWPPAGPWRPRPAGEQAP